MIFTNSTVSASYSVKAKQGIDRKSSIEKSYRFGRSSGKVTIRSCNNYQCHLTLFVGFKRESTRDSDEYNLAIRAVNLFDLLDLNI